MWIVVGRGCFQKAIPGLLNRSKNVILEAAGVFFKGCNEEQEKKYISQLELQSFFLKKFSALVVQIMMMMPQNCCFVEVFVYIFDVYNSRRGGFFLFRFFLL